jgi:hypothetical protein
VTESANPTTVSVGFPRSPVTTIFEPSGMNIPSPGDGSLATTIWPG